VKPLTIRRDGVATAAGVVGTGAFWSLYVGLAVAVLANVVADGSPPGLGYVVLSAAVVLGLFSLVSTYAWVAVLATRQLVRLRRR
jgi:hypothetical protein